MTVKGVVELVMLALRNMDVAGIRNFGSESYRLLGFQSKNRWQ